MKPEKSTASRWRRLPRPLRWLLWSLLFLWGIYLVAGNLFLRPALGPRWVTRQPQKMQIRWTGGWTVFPGHLHVRDLELKARNQKQLWALELDRANLSVSLLGLARKHFRLRRLRGQGLEFRLRPPAAKTPDTEGEAAEIDDALPVIFGFADDPPPPVARKKRQPWRISIDRLAVEQVREIWLRRHRWAGSGRLQGSLSFELRGPLRVDSSHLVLNRGVIWEGQRQASDVERLEARVQIHPFAPGEHRGLDALRFFSGRLAVDAPRADLDVLDFFLRGSPWIEIDGEGALQIDLGLDHGVLETDSQLHAWAGAEVEYLDYRIAGRARLRGEVAEAAAGAPGHRPRGTLQVVFDDYELRERGAETAHVVGGGARIEVVTTELDLVTPQPDLEVAVELPKSQIPHFAYYNRFLPRSAATEILAGSGEIEGNLRLETAANRISGQLQIDAQGVDVRFEGVEVRGNLKLLAMIPDGHITDRRFDISGTRLEIDGATLVAGQAALEENGWWAKVEVPRGSVRLIDKVPILATSVTAEMRDTSPLVTLLERTKSRPVWLRKLLTVEDITAHGELLFRDQDIWLNDFELGGRKLEVHAQAHVSETEVQALLFCKYRVFSASLEMLDKQRDWDLVGSRKWYARKTEEWKADQATLWPVTNE